MSKKLYDKRDVEAIQNIVNSKETYEHIFERQKINWPIGNNSDGKECILLQGHGLDYSSGKVSFQVTDAKQNALDFQFNDSLDPLSVTFKQSSNHARQWLLDKMHEHGVYSWIPLRFDYKPKIDLSSEAALNVYYRNSCAAKTDGCPIIVSFGISASDFLPGSVTGSISYSIEGDCCRHLPNVNYGTSSKEAKMSFSQQSTFQAKKKIVGNMSAIILESGNRHVC